MEKCNFLIKIKNKYKPLNANAAVILQIVHDEEFFANSTILLQLDQLAKTHYVVFQLIDFQKRLLKDR